jgi:hypothetical protein
MIDGVMSFDQMLAGMTAANSDAQLRVEENKKMEEREKQELLQAERARVAAIAAVADQYAADPIEVKLAVAAIIGRQMADPSATSETAGLLAAKEAAGQWRAMAAKTVVAPVVIGGAPLDAKDRAVAESKTRITALAAGIKSAERRVK